jgi:hypothetical protein
MATIHLLRIVKIRTNGSGAATPFRQTAGKQVCNTTFEKIRFYLSGAFEIKKGHIAAAF